MNVEKADLAEIEQVTIETEPDIHVAAEDVVGQMIQIMKADPARVSFVKPAKLGVVGAVVAILVDEIDQRTADAVDRWDIHDLAVAVIRNCPFRDCVIEGVLRVDYAPPHRSRAGSVRLSKLRRVAGRVGIDQIGDVALLPYLDGFFTVRRHMGVAHAREKVTKHIRVGMRKLYKFKAVCAGRVLVANHGMGGVMWKGPHGLTPLEPVVL